jgi:hypothetical protein
MGKTTTQVHYGCAGSCGGQVTEEQYKAGKTTCGDKSCDMYGKSLQKMEHCAGCGEDYLPEAAADHDGCN